MVDVYVISENFFVCEVRVIRKLVLAHAPDYFGPKGRQGWFKCYLSSIFGLRIR